MLLVGFDFLPVTSTYLLNWKTVTPPLGATFARAAIPGLQNVGEQKLRPKTFYFRHHLLHQVRATCIFPLTRGSVCPFSCNVIASNVLSGLGPASLAIRSIHCAIECVDGSTYFRPNSGVCLVSWNIDTSAQPPLGNLAPP